MRLFDGLRNLVSGLGTAKDKAFHNAYVFTPIGQFEAEALYLEDGLARKIVEIVPDDMTREWRTWTASQAEELYRAEKALQIRARVNQALVWERLYGGSAILIGDGAEDPTQRLDVSKVAQGGIQYLHVFTRYDLQAVDPDRDVRSPDFGKPRAYRITASGADQAVEVHRSRFVVFEGPNTPRLIRESNDGWGVSVFQAIRAAIVNVSASAANAAALVEEAKVDVIKKANLANHLADPEAERKLLARFTLAMQMKSSIQTLLIDKDNEEFERKQISFTGLPELIRTHIEIAAGVADLPVTRLLGTAPKGMNATGDHDTRNYYDSVRSKQANGLASALERLDEALIRHVLGDRPGDVTYAWTPLWQPTPEEAAKVADQKAKTTQTYCSLGLFPQPGFAKAVRAQLIEDGTYGALDQHVGEADLDEVDEQELARAEAELEAGRAQLGDAAPRTLYVSRAVTNAREIIAWARRQGFTTTLAPEDLHVTVAYSRAPVDWMKVGESWSSRITVPAGGPRLVEPLGPKRAVVLLFSCAELRWRHESIREAGALWDHEGYQPHVTLTYDPGEVDLSRVEPFEGEIELGPERFREVDENWSAGITERPTTVDAHPFFAAGGGRRADRPFADAYDPAQPRVPAGQPGGGRWVGRLSDVIAAAGKDKFVLANLGAVTEAERIKELTDQDVSGFLHALTNQAVSHALRHHGNAQKERSRGQIAVTGEDFRKAAEIVRRPDAIGPGADTGRNGEPRLVYQKRIEGVTYVYVAEIKRGKRRIDAVTMWKR